MSKLKDKKIIEQAINRMHKRFSLKLDLPKDDCAILHTTKTQRICQTLKT